MPLTYTTLHFARSIILNNPSFALLRPSLRYATAMGLITCYTAHCVRSTGPDISLVSLAPFHVTYASFRSLSLTTFAALRLIRSFHSLLCTSKSLLLLVKEATNGPTALGTALVRSLRSFHSLHFAALLLIRSLWSLYCTMSCCYSK